MQLDLGAALFEREKNPLQGTAELGAADRARGDALPWVVADFQLIGADQLGGIIIAKPRHYVDGAEKRSNRQRGGGFPDFARRTQLDQQALFHDGDPLAH